MFGLDEWITGLGSGSLAVALAVAFLLGLRHATDPDHLTAVSTLVISDPRDGARRAGWLGLFWGLGHAATLFAFGLPIILFNRYLPDAVQRGAEVLIGAAIVLLSVRLLIRWRRGHYHSHPHEHGGLRHAHPHVHESSGLAAHPVAHRHPHAESLGRSPLAAFGLGLVHGVGGSAGAGVLLVAAVSDSTEGIIALLLFAAATALSMAAVSSLFGHALARGMVGRSLERLVPVFGVFSLLFGAWYALAALDLPSLSLI